MAKKTTKTIEEQPTHPYAVALGLIQAAKEDETQKVDAAKTLAGILNNSSTPERQVLHNVTEAVMLGEYDKAEFLLTSLMLAE